jgi:hypothetical protein
MALAVLIGFADGFFHPAFGGILPLVVDQPVLASANSISRSPGRGARSSASTFSARSR